PIVLPPANAGVPMRKNDTPLRPKGRHRREITDREPVFRQWRALRQPRRAGRRARFDPVFRALARFAVRRFTAAFLRALATLRRPRSGFLAFRPVFRALRRGAFFSAFLRGRLSLAAAGAAANRRAMASETSSMEGMPLTVFR